MRTHKGAAALCAVVVVVALALGVFAPPARAESGQTVEQIIKILKDKGLIDGEQQERLLMKHSAEAGSNPPVGADSILDGWDFYGDLRLRHELFTYQHDTNGGSRDNRYRLRYRGRLGFQKELSDSLAIGMRFVTGGSPSTSEHRSTNQTLGSGNDFDFDAIWVERAYVKWSPGEFGGVKAKFVAGKMANPFVWKNGKDGILWDGDITPEGGAALFSYKLYEGSSLFANFGYFIDDENSTDADPKAFAAQLGGTTKLGAVDLGLRSSMYWWRSLDTSFVTRSDKVGNLPTAFESGKSRVGEVSAFAAAELSENWPVKVYGTYAKNFSADSGMCGLFDANADTFADNVGCKGGGNGAALGALERIGSEDVAWGAGIEVGSSKKIAKLGFGYFHIEANSVMSLFTDSDLLDGFTNRRGWTIYGGRRLTQNTEFKFAYFKANRLENDRGGLTGPLFFSTRDSKRSRLQTDLVFNF